MPDMGQKPRQKSAAAYMWRVPLSPAAYEHGPVHPDHPLRGLDHACDVFEYLEDENRRVSKADQRALVREARKVLALFAPPDRGVR